MGYHIDDLRCLLAVVQAGSMARAAPALGVSTAAVSRRIARLEQDLGVRLLNRSTRGIRATADAEALLRAAGPLLGELEEAVTAALHDAHALAGRLRITAPRAVAENFLAQWLLELATEHPALQIELIATDAWVDVVAEAVDVAIRVGPLPDSDDTAVRLGSVAYALVHGGGGAAEVRDALRAGGWASLAELPAVIAAPYRTWRASRGGRELGVEPLPAFTVNSLSLAAAAVARGVGVGYLPADVAARASLQTIALEPFGIRPIHRPVFAVTPRGRLRRRKVSAVVERIRAGIAREGADLGITPGRA